MLGRGALPQDRHQGSHEDDEQHRSRRTEVEDEDHEQREHRGQAVEQQLALERERAQARPDQDVARLAEVAREEDDDSELCELGRLELDGAELDCEEGAVHLPADPWQPRRRKQSDRHRRDRVAIALQHVMVANREDRAAEEDEPDDEPLGLLAGQLGVDPVDQHQPDGGEQGPEREEVGIGIRQARPDEEVGDDAQPQEHGAVGESRVGYVLGARCEHGGEAGGHEQRDGQEPEQLPRARRHQREASREAGPAPPPSS